jgi:hypothetical protein
LPPSPTRSRCCLLQQHAAARNRVVERYLPRHPGNPVPAAPGCGPFRAHTAPVRARPCPVPTSPSSPGTRPGCGRPRPACRAREYPAHAAGVLPRAPKPFRERVQTKVPSGLAASNAGHGRHRHPEVPCRCPVHRRQAASRSGRQHWQRIYTSAGHQQVSLSVTALAKGNRARSSTQGGRSRPLV